MALVLLEGSMDLTWGTIRLDAPGTSPVVNILRQSEHVSGCVWEVRLLWLRGRTMGSTY